jgi:hypothetical protein
MTPFSYSPGFGGTHQTVNNDFEFVFRSPAITLHACPLRPL